MADTNVAIKLYKASATSKCVGINVTNSIDTTGYALYVNGNTYVKGNVHLTGSGSRYKYVSFYQGSGSNVGYIRYDSGNATNVTTGKFRFQQYSGNATATTSASEYYESFSLPTTAQGLTAVGDYVILTSKNAVTVAQGGTGATTAADARTNLGIGASGTHADSYFALASHTHSYAASPAVGGGATYVRITDTTPTSTTTYYVLYAVGKTEGSDYSVRANADLYYYDTGTTSYLNVGSSSNTGGLTLHNANDKYVTLVPAAVTANRTITLPDATGTVSLEGHTHSIYLPISYSALDFTSTDSAPGIYPIAGTNNPVTEIAEYGSAIQFSGSTASRKYYAAQLVISSASGASTPTHMYVRRMTSTPGWGVWSTVFDNRSNLIPAANTTYNIGSSSYKYSNVYATTFNGALSGNATNVTGTVAVDHGGTGATTAAAARTNLGLNIVSLYNGTLKTGSTDINTGGNYQYLIVQGYPGTGTNTYLATTIISIAQLSSTATYYIVSSEGGFVTFSATISSATVTITINSVYDTSKSCIKRIWGVN